MKFTAARGVDPQAFDERVRWAGETLDYLDRIFGLKPDDFDVDEVRLHPVQEIGALGDYYPDERLIGIPDTLLPHLGEIRPGMYKAANGRWKNVFRHELGHAWQAPFERAARKIDPDFSLRSEFRKASATTVRDLSWYSRHNHFEWFAEAFSSYTHPRFESSGVRLSDSLLALFKTIIPRCECDGECHCHDAATVTKTAADYVDHPIAGEQCSECTMFRSPRACTLVIGDIAPEGHCKHFDAVLRK